MTAPLRSSSASWTTLLLCGALGACTGVVAPVSGTGATPGTGSGGSSGTASGGTGVGTSSGGSGVGTGTGGTGVGTGTGGTGVGTGTGGTGGPTVAPLAVVLDGTPVFSRFVRLTNEQWENTVKDLLQLSAPSGLTSTFEGAPPSGNFSNNEKSLFITSGLWTDYESAAETLSQKVARDATALSKVTGAPPSPQPSSSPSDAAPTVVT